MSAHTPGPWISTPDPCWHDEAMIGIEGSKPDHVACCALKDAALISAAPDMYDALKVAPNPHGYENPDDYCAASAEWFLLMRNAALAKAGGQ